MQKDYNSEASQLLVHSLFYGAFLPQEHLISTGSSYLRLKIITWKLSNVTLVQDSLKNVFQQVSNCSVLTQRFSTNYTKLYSGMFYGLQHLSHESNYSLVFVQTAVRFLHYKNL